MNKTLDALIAENIRLKKYKSNARRHSRQLQVSYEKLLAEHRALLAERDLKLKTPLPAIWQTTGDDNENRNNNKENS